MKTLLHKRSHGGALEVGHTSMIKAKAESKFFVARAPRPCDLFR